MTKFSPDQHADLSRRCRDVLEKLRGAMNGAEYAGDTRYVLLDIRDLLIAHGWPAAGFAARAWCDAIIDATPRAEVGRETRIAFASPDHDEIVDPVHVSTERRWAANLLGARFSGDQITVYSQIDSLPRNNGVLIYLFRMAEIAAHVLNEYEASPVGPLSPGLYRETAPGVYSRTGDET